MHESQLCNNCIFGDIFCDLVKYFGKYLPRPFLQEEMHLPESKIAEEPSWAPLRHRSDPEVLTQMSCRFPIRPRRVLEAYSKAGVVDFVAMGLWHIVGQLNNDQPDCQ